MNNVQMIFGAPGCGKTTALMKILEEELKSTSPDKISFVSFTKQGSYEGRDRAMRRFGYKEKDFPYFRTIHSLAFRALGLSKYDVINRAHYKEFSHVMGMNFVGYYTEDFINNDDRYLFYESLRKNNKKAAEKIFESLNYQNIRRVEHNYTRYKKHVGIKDFDDMIIDFITRGESIPVEIAIIDEAQDLTSLQWEFCRLAFRDCKRIYIAGDDDQAIYEWSGADIEYFLSLTKDSKIRVLDKSYRLKSNILDFSKSITNKLRARVYKEFDPVSNGGNIVYLGDIKELEINNEQSYYFLSRNNYFLPKIKEHFVKLGCAFWYKGKHSINQNIVKSIIKYEGYRKEKDIDTLMRDVMTKDLLKADFSSFDPWYEVFNLEIEDLNYYRKLVENKADTSQEHTKITISTIHGVKGGEADNVILLLDITKNVYNSMYKDIESELRCLYVACTRTKNNLYLINSKGKHSYTDFIKF